MSSSSSPSRQPGPPPPTAQAWLLFLVISMLGGSSFSAIKISIDTATPFMVAAGRLWISTIALYIYMKTTGRTFPPLREKGGGWSPVWGFALAIGVVGYAVPMVLFPFAQQSVSSLLAGIYMAFMPIATVVLAALFADEPVTKRKLLGFLAGVLGVGILIGPAAVKNILGESIIAQVTLIIGTIGYAVAVVVTRKAPPVAARSFAVMMMLIAAILVTPFALTEFDQLRNISPQSWAGIVYLGLLPTATTAIMIIHLVRTAGAGFMAMCNYVTPVTAIAFGVLLFGEAVEWKHLFGLAAILSGIAISQPETIERIRQSIVTTRKS
ncbi:MAG: EamA family transporter [Pseudomonadota bacterium]